MKKFGYESRFKISFFKGYKKEIIDIKNGIFLKQFWSGSSRPGSATLAITVKLKLGYADSRPDMCIIHVLKAEDLCNLRFKPKVCQINPLSEYEEERNRSTKFNSKAALNLSLIIQMSFFYKPLYQSVLR